MPGWNSVDRLNGCRQEVRSGPPIPASDVAVLRLDLVARSTSSKELMSLVETPDGHRRRFPRAAYGFHAERGRED
jgi:hypothetical protein